MALISGKESFRSKARVRGRSSKPVDQSAKASDDFLKKSQSGFDQYSSPRPDPAAIPEIHFRYDFWGFPRELESKLETLLIRESGDEVDEEEEAGWAAVDNWEIWSR